MTLDNAKRVHEWHPKPMDVHEHFVWDQIITWRERKQNLREQKRLAKTQMKLIHGAMRAFKRMMKKVEWATLKVERIKEERIKEEKRFYEQILDRNKDCRDRWVQPTREAFKVLSFRVKTYPWRVLSVHEKTIVVEQVSKMGTKYRVTYRKSFMEDVEIHSREENRAYHFGMLESKLQEVETVIAHQDKIIKETIQKLS